MINKKTEKIKLGFAKRLMQVMLDHGFVSPKYPKKANTQKLADASGVSRQMAARYLNGDALPDTKVLSNIADWLTCDPWWLLYGSKKQEPNNKPTGKLSEEIFLYIVSEMRELIALKAHNATSFNDLFDNIISIYSNVLEIDSGLEAKKKSAAIMINFIKRQYQLA